jgi:hypothetical protein
MLAGDVNVAEAKRVQPVEVRDGEDVHDDVDEDAMVCEVVKHVAQGFRQLDDLRQQVPPRRR